MKDWQVDRLKINRLVRSVMVTHFIDLGRLAIHVYPGKITVRGSLLKLPGAPGKLSSDVVRDLFREIEGIPGVRRVLATLDNWRQEGNGTWVDRSRKTRGRKALQALASRTQRYERDRGVGDVHGLEFDEESA